MRPPPDKRHFTRQGQEILLLIRELAECPLNDGALLLEGPLALHRKSIQWAINGLITHARTVDAALRRLDPPPDSDRRKK